MSSLLSTIKEDQLVHRKRGTVGTHQAKFLGLVYSDSYKIGKDDGNRETTDEEVLKVIRKFVKNSEATKKFLLAAKGKDNSDTEYLDSVPLALKALDDEIELLNKYLPKKLTKEEIKGKLIGLDITNTSAVMKHFKENYTELYDGAELASLIKQLQNQAASNV